jgi:hypothetical protein
MYSLERNYLEDNSKVLKFVLMKGDVIYACLFYNIFSIQNELLDISWPIKEALRKK